MRFELHCHSTCSDGTEPAARVATRAAERGVDVFALTDHDTCEATGLPVAGARSIRGVEVTCEENGRTIHLLVYDRGHGLAPVEARLGATRAARVNRLRVMAARLAQRGVTIDVEPLLAVAATRSVGRPDLARAMVAAGVVTSMKEAFSRHLYDGGPVDVKHQALPLVDALALGRECDAAMALAHPHLYDERSAPMARTYRAAGLTGIEACYGVYDARERKRWIEVADANGLVCTGGSDWHGPDEAQAQPGVDFDEPRSAALATWLGL